MEKVKPIEKTIEKNRCFLGSFTVIGKDKVTNQDNCLVGCSEQYGIAYIFVADGLGSCQYSDQGSKRVNEIAEAWVLNELPKYRELTDSVANIFYKKLVDAWEDSFLSTESYYEYDTTFHAAIYYRDAIMIGGIGDGMAVIEMDGTNPIDLVEAGDLFSNVTNSMCSLDVRNLIGGQTFRMAANASFSAVILSSDGIADDIIPEKKLTLPEYFYSVISEKGINALQTEIEEWLDDWQTEGHSDDKTIAYMIIEREI